MDEEDDESDGAVRESLNDDEILDKGKQGRSKHIIDDEDIQTTLTDLNDVAIQSLLKGDEPATTGVTAPSTNNNEVALENLKRAEQILEQITAEGKDVDRNLIVVILYNLACTYQRLQMLEDCASYLDGTIYNLEAKVTNFDENQDIIQQMLQQQDGSQEESGDGTDDESRQNK